MPESRPPLAARRERRKDARPGELLGAALEVFVEKGFAATRTEEVAARAGVSKGTLFRYFPSKDELFQAVVRETVSHHMAYGLSQIMEHKGSSAELLRHLLREWWLRFGATPGSGLLKLVLSESVQFPELARFYQSEVVGPGRALVARVLERGIAAGEFRPVDVAATVQTVLGPLILMALWRHTMGHCCEPSMPLTPLDFIDHHTDLLVHTLRPKDTA